MKYLSVCSGIEAATVAWHDLGWTPVAFSEIEPFPSAVLKHHYPHVPNVGDMTKFKEWNLEPIDLLVGGTPCQSFSVAGLRKGLDDPRGNLMLTFLAIAERYRPRWIVWENVPGVLSSNGGRDFGTFLGALGELGYGWAYRVLDAQWFGVAQRRRRVFVVGHLGDWQRAAQVLFERESVQRNPPPSRQARQGAAAGVGGSTYLGNAEGGARDAPYLTCSNIDSHVNNQTPLVAHTLRGVGFDAGEDGTGRGTPLVPVVFKVRGGVEREDGSRGSTNIGKQAGKGYLGSEERAFTLAAAQDQFVAQPVAFHPTQDPISSEDGTTHAMGCGSKGGAATVAVAQPVAFRDTADCLTAAYGTKWNGNASADNGSLFAAQPVAFDILGVPATNGAKETEVHTPLRARMPGQSEASTTTVVAQPIPNGSHWDDPRNPHPTLNQASQGSGAIGYGNQELFSQRGGGLVPVGTDCYNGAITGEVAATIGTPGSSVNASGPTVMQAMTYGISNQPTPKFGEDVCPSLDAKASGGGRMEAVASAMQVRRLTPTECERLQGFPDGYTNIPWRKKPEAPDGPRYKALGNSMAVPCMKWIGERIQAATARQEVPK